MNHGNNSYRKVNHDQDSHSTLKISNIKHRVSFKQTNTRNSLGNGLTDSKVRAILDDEDMRIIIMSPCGWYKFLIQDGAKFQKTEILQIIHTAMQPDTFAPLYYKIDDVDKSSYFYVDDHAMAEKIMVLDRKLSLPDGFKMMLKVQFSMPKMTRFEDGMKERMKLVMGKRYNPAIKALDLTKFHADPDLSDLFCPLASSLNICSMIQIIAEKIPDLEALNLNDNKINQMDHLKMLADKLKCIKTLYMANNKIFIISALDNLSGLPLIEAVFDGNPFKNRNRQKCYVSEMKKRFPKLIKLDGAEMEPTIGFDVVNESATVQIIPAWKGMFFIAPQVQDLVQNFLQQYYMFYDSDNRQQLLEAYHDDAILSITATNNQHPTPEEGLQANWKCGRNLLNPKGYEYRFSSLKNGNLNVVAMLNELPASQHDHLSFTIDLTFFSPQMILLTVTGLFKERSINLNAEYARTFSKTMVLVPSNNGVCIRNEMLHINYASLTQARDAFKAPVTSTSQIPATPAATATVAEGQPDDDTQIDCSSCGCWKWYDSY